MPQIIFGPQQTGKLDGSVKKAAFAFLEKLGESDATPGLHIEPIEGTIDPRVRTGRINDFWRAVLVKIQGQASDAHYVYLGAYPHDDAITFAKTVQLVINPRNGIAELVAADAASAVEAAIAGALGGEGTVPVGATEKPKPLPEDVDTTVYPLLETQGVTLDQLLDLGIERAFAERALTITDEGALLNVAGTTSVAWQGEAVLDLATGKKLDAVRASYGIGVARPDGTVVVPPTAQVGEETDDDLLVALQHPAAGLQFAFIEDDEELRQAIEDDDFGKWRVFLHPEQRDYAVRPRNGSFRLSGGAGTGKTVVLLHRAKHLARTDPTARIVLTTYNKTLAASLAENLRLLDPRLPIVDRLGSPGIYIASVDAIAYRILRDADRKLGGNASGAPGPVADVLGPRPHHVLDLTAHASWGAAIDSGGTKLPTELRSEAFLEAEYTTVVLPNRVLTRESYLKVRRPGRGVALDRARRNAIWDVVEAYRAAAAAAGSTDWDEKALVAATYLDAAVDAGGARPADHVLVDEGQDLSPSRLLFLRSLVEAGKDDLFLAEDSQQRIYGQKIVLSKYGINIRGRSRRLTLNYRTTAQNLHYATGILDEQRIVDLDGEAASSDGYRSARTGPTPELVACTSLAEEYREAARIVRAWIAAGDAPETIGLLVYTQAVAGKLQSGLADHGVEARFVSSDASVDKGRPVIMTMHRSKGMEFKRVLLFGLDTVPGLQRLSHLPEADRDDATLRERSLLYVAATRARDELVVMWKGERSELLPEVA